MEASAHDSTSLKPEAEALCFGDIKIGNKGLRKRVLKKGISWQVPSTGDEIEVHYNMSLLDGEYFDSTRDKGTPFKFKLGQGEVIKGWDDGIATMRKGERAVFTIPPELAYGEIGAPPMIPPNSTLIFDVEVVSWYPIRDVSGDGGILKKITKEGEGWATPKDADEVLVKYVAKTETGNIISKSDEGLEFSLENGHLCPDMGIAVKTMRKGEKADLSVKFSYGLKHHENGTSVIQGAILTNLKLIIHLELVSWKTVVDIMGDRKILKKIVKVGEGFDRPNEGSRARVIYIGKLDDGKVFESKGNDEEPFEYLCGEEQINEGLDRAIMTMKKGEEALVKISSAVSMSYEAKLIDFIKEKPFWKMDPKERIEACERKKNDGNILFKAGKYRLASKKYEKALTFLDYNHSFNDQERLRAKSLKISCNLNNAACKLKFGEHTDVARLCTRVLEIDPFNVKALFRRSQAYIEKRDLEKAEEDINRALAIEPRNKDLMIKQKDLKEKQMHYVQQETRFFSTIISKLG